MKKLAPIMMAFSSLSLFITVYPAKTKQSEAEMLGQQVIRELGDKIKQENNVFRAAVTATERQDALKNAHEAAQTLLNTLNDIKTFGSNTARGYTPAQRRLAAITLAELLTRENSVNVEIKSKRMEIKDMTDPNSLFSFAKSGKSEARAQAEKDIKKLHSERNNVRKAISDQEAILGPEWSDTIRLATNNLIVGSSYGIAYGIDWYFGDHGAKLMTEKTSAPAAKSKAARSKKQPSLTDKQKAAIKSWHHLRKSELLSKEITTAYQLTQAKELLNNLNAIQEDLKDVPSKHKHVLDKVTENADSLARKIDRSKTRWLK
jgi:hypothetical protein